MLLLALFILIWVKFGFLPMLFSLVIGNLLYLIFSRQVSEEAQ